MIQVKSPRIRLFLFCLTLTSFLLLFRNSYVSPPLSPQRSASSTSTAVEKASSEEIATTEPRTDKTRPGEKIFSNAWQHGSNALSRLRTNLGTAGKCLLAIPEEPSDQHDSLIQQNDWRQPSVEGVDETGENLEDLSLTTDNDGNDINNDSNNDSNNGNDEASLQESKAVPPTDFLIQQFAKHGLGQKMCEVMLGLHFARANNLTYVFDAPSFLKNYRSSNLTWIADLLKRRFGTLEDHHALFLPTGDFVPSSEEPRKNSSRIHVSDYFGRVEDLIQKQEEGQGKNQGDNSGAESESHESQRSKSPRLFESTTGTACNDSRPDERTCWLKGISIYNQTRDLQDLLWTRPESESTEDMSKHEPIERLAIHVRLGDVHLMLSPEEYIALWHGIKAKHGVSIKPEEVHFVYLASEADQDLIQPLQDALPKAQFHNFASTEETIRFLANSKYQITSGSSLSYLGSFFCTSCVVIITPPKEYAGENRPYNEETYKSNLYHMDEWIPYFEYLQI